MNFQVYNDKVYILPLKCQSASGAPGAWGPREPTPVSGNPNSLGATIRWVDPNYFLVLTPKVQTSPGLSVSVSYVGMASANIAVDIIPDPNLISVIIDSNPANVTSEAQNVPTAPGP